VRTDLQRQIAALRQEVRELVRRRGGALPDVKEWHDLMLALVGRDGAGAMAEADPTGPQVIGEHVREMRIAPAAEPLRACLLTALDCAVRADAHCYRAAVKALRPVLDELLAARGAKWDDDISAGYQYIDLYRCAHEWLLYPEGERPAYIASRPKGADVMVMAGLALRCAAQDLDKWQAWYGGGEAQAQHQLCLAEGSGPQQSSTADPAEMWARCRLEHELPPAEEAILIERGLVTQEQVDGVRALPPIPPGRVADSR
jgi:hypothetical protein